MSLDSVTEKHAFKWQARVALAVNASDLTTKTLNPLEIDNHKPYLQVTNIGQQEYRFTLHAPRCHVQNWDGGQPLTLGVLDTHRKVFTYSDVSKLPDKHDLLYQEIEHALTDDFGYRLNYD